MPSRKVDQVAVLLVIVLVTIGVWQKFGRTDRHKDPASGSGRIEAVEIDIEAYRQTIED